jgi:hypothetical protein
MNHVHRASWLSKLWQTPKWPCLIGVLLATLISRAVYFLYFGVRFDDEPLQFYMQYIDPELLRTTLVESLFYLRDQPPGFNLFLGVFLKLFDGHTGAFHASFVIFGLLLAAGTYLLMVRLRMPAPYAAIFATFFAITPGTVLYENWLFYAYPLATVMSLSALFLHRFLSDKKTLDGFIFCSLLSITVLMYGVFHLAWQALIVGALLLTVRANWRTIFIVGLLPLAVSGSVYVKNYVLFGNLSSNGVISGSSIVILATRELRPEELKILKEDRSLSPITWSMLDKKWSFRDYRPYVPVFEKTGVRLLDQEIKSSGSENYNYTGWSYIGKILTSDALYVMRRHPGAYLTHVWSNFRLYFRSSSDHHFDRGSISQYSNGRKLARVLRIFHAVTAWSNWAVLPGSILFAGLFGLTWLIRRYKGADREDLTDADGFTILFCLFNTLYVALITMGMTFADHNRYRFSVMPFYYVFFAMLLWRVVITTTVRSQSLKEERD